MDKELTWRKLESTIIQHMLCACDGLTHFKALRGFEQKKLTKKHYKGAESFTKSALVSIQAKSAAVDYKKKGGICVFS